MTEPRQPRLHGTAFALRDPFPWPEFVQLAREGEGLGYSAVFLPEIAGRDTLVALGRLAGETEDLRLGTGIIPMSSRTPWLTAMAAATVHERSAGRLVLGIGTGPAVPGALDRLRSLVVTIRRLLSGEAVESDGADAPPVPRPGGSGADLDVGPGPSRDARGGRGRRRRAAELVHARARPRRADGDPGRSGCGRPRPGRT